MGFGDLLKSAGIKTDTKSRMSNAKQMSPFMSTFFPDQNDFKLELPPYQQRNLKSYIKQEKPITFKDIGRVKLANTAFGTLDQANANAATAMAKRFDQQRAMASEEYNQAQDKNLNALQRRFTAMGAGGSGARLKLEQLANDENMRQRASTMKDIGTEQEAIASERDLQNAQLKAQMQSQYDLTQGQMDQALNMANADQRMKNADLNFRQRVFSFERGSKMFELDMAQQQQIIDRAVSKFNSEIANEMAKPPKKGLISNALGPAL